MMINGKFDADTESISFYDRTPGDFADGEVTTIKVATNPAKWRRYIVNEPPPFGTGEVGPFDTLAAAFDYMRSRGYKLDDQACAEMIARESEDE